jgi:hypothetical protein
MSKEEDPPPPPYKPFLQQKAKEEIKLLGGMSFCGRKFAP